MKLRYLVSVGIAALLSSCLFGKSEGQCTLYCDRMEENCDDATFQTDGDFDRDKCVEACSDYPDVPVAGVALGDAVPDGDTLQCRTYHAGNAAGEPNGEHCTHADIGGATTCVKFKDPCAEYCVGAGVEGFAGIVELCPGSYASADACGAFCNSLPAGRRGDRLGNTRHCRLTYAVESSDREGGRCLNAGKQSIACEAGGPDVP